MSHLLSRFLSYQSWANQAFFDSLESVDQTRHPNEYHQAIRLLNHIHVVGQIFAGHLTGRPHGYAADNTEETPEMADLRHAVTISDQWYCDYLSTLTGDALAETIAFTFTDGDRGAMTREEMLGHVVTHGCYHRGEIGRILGPTDASLPWDTFAVFLHQTQPERRRHDALQLAL